MTYTLEKQTMTKAKVVKFLELLSETDLPIVTMMPLLHDTLKAYIPSYEVWVFLVNEQMEPTEYYGEKIPNNIHHLINRSGDQFASNTFEQNDSAEKPQEKTMDPASFQSFFAQERRYGNLLKLTKEYLEGATYQHIFKPVGIHYVVGASVIVEVKPTAIVGIFRQEHEPAFTEADATLVGEIYPLLVKIFSRKDTPKPRTLSTPRFFEKSTMLVVDDQGKIIFKKRDAFQLLSSALASKSRFLLNQENTIPPQCVLFNEKLKESASELIDVTLDVPFGHLILRSYELDSADDTVTHYGVHIDFYGDVGEALLHYLRVAGFPPSLMKIAYFIGTGESIEKVATRLSIKKSSMKTYLNRLYQAFYVSNIDDFREALLESTKEYLQKQTARRHFLMQFSR